MRVVTITDDGFVASLPTSADRPGRFSGFTRDGVMRHVFELAATNGFEVRAAGQHWDTSEPRQVAVKLASDQLGRVDIAHRNRVFESKLGKGH